MYPIAFIETIEEEDGSKRIEGPHNEDEERVLCEKWTVSYIFLIFCRVETISNVIAQARRQIEAEKLQIVYKRKMEKWHRWIERLELGLSVRFIDDALGTFTSYQTYTRKGCTLVSYM